MSDSIMNWCNEQNIDIGELYFIVKQKYEIEKVNEETRKFKINRELIGKCYKHFDKYYKVISERANNSCQVSCLTFSEHPRFYFKSLLSITTLYSEYAGKFIFEGVRVKDVMVGTRYGTIFGITDYEEITEEEFNDAYKNYCEELLQVDWSKSYGN